MNEMPTIVAISLRDWFAGQAMAAMLTGVVRIGTDGDTHAYATGSCNSAIVDRAYVIADVMLSARTAAAGGEKKDG